jgi:urease accessory protein
MRADPRAVAARCVRVACGIAALMAIPVPAAAHTNPGVASGFLSGVTHPLTGIDHVLAMVAVGIWGTQLGRPAIWLLPISFPVVMALGGVLGIRGIPIPGVEIGIAASALFLGLMIVLSARVPIAIAAALVGSFAIFHGYAHGKELPVAADPLAFGVGFVLITGLLHIAGIGIGVMGRWPNGLRVLRGIGAGICLAGVYLLVELVS